MASATLIHFGSDDCLRIPVLRRAGYEVRMPLSLDSLRLDLQDDDDVDAIIVSGAEPACAKRAIHLVRRRSSAPLILFRRPDAAIEEGGFDRVFSPSMTEPQWLFEMAVVVMQHRELRAQSDRLRAEIMTLREDLLRLRAQLKLERLRNADAGGLWQLEGLEKD
jgi:hypothetical protein